MLTPRVDSNHDLFGFIPSWIDELSKRVGHLSIITGYLGQYELPANVNVESYGRDGGLPKWRRMLRLQRKCFHYAKSDIDVIFSHMNPKYVLATWPWFGPQGIPYVQWYAHGEVNPALRIADRLVEREVTPASAAFPIDSDKVCVVGHGIDMRKFSPNGTRVIRNRIIGVGRIDPVKDYETTIRAIHIVKNRSREVEFIVYGSRDSSPSYYEKLRRLVHKLELTENVNFVGSVPHNQIVHEYRKAGIVVNAGGSGSLDKVEVESLACGTPMISCDTAFKQLVADTGLEETLTYEPNHSEMLAEKIIQVLRMGDEEYEELGLTCRDIVVNKHNVSGLMRTITKVLRDAKKSHGDG